MNIQRAIVAALIVWLLGVSAYTLSFFFSFMADPELQANIVLVVALIPCAWLGAYFYYKNGAQTHGLRLGTSMFAIAMFLDALITVPVFILPQGGSYVSFFTDPGFWFIAFLYITVVVVYWKFRVAGRGVRTERAR